MSGGTYETFANSFQFKLDAVLLSKVFFYGCTEILTLTTIFPMYPTRLEIFR